MTVDRSQIEGKVVLSVAGRMDAESAVQFEVQCNSCVSEGISSLVIDLGDLSYVSSMGLRSFVAIAIELRTYFCARVSAAWRSRPHFSAVGGSHSGCKTEPAPAIGQRKACAWQASFDGD